MPGHAVTPSLTSCVFRLQVAVYYEHGEDRSVMLISTVPQLPLRDLTIRYIDSQMGDGSPTDGHGLPRCRELADLHSRSLTRLRVDVLSDLEGDNTLRLVGLPELRCCQLRNGVGLGLRSPLSLCIDAMSFRGAPHLESLRIRNDEGLQLQNGSLEALTRLTCLTLERCGLRSVPAGVAALGATLRVLDLDSNARLQLDEAGVAAILQCSRLTTLGLARGVSETGSTGLTVMHGSLLSSFWKTRGTHQHNLVWRAYGT